MSGTILGFPEPPRPAPTGEMPDSLARRVNAAVAAIEPGKRGRLILSVTKERAGVDLMWRIGGPASVVARVAKPFAGPAEAEVLLNVNFAVSPETQREAAKAVARAGGRIGFGDCYRALRAEHPGVKRNGRLRAFIKAFGMAQLGKRPYLDGGEWFDDGDER